MKNKKPMTRDLRKKLAMRFLLSLVRGLFLLGICFTVLYPILSKLFYSFMQVTDVFSSTISYLPSHPTLANYRAAIELLQYGPTFLRTFLLAVTVALFQLAMSLPVAYGLARFQFRGRTVLFIALIIVMVIPPDLLLLPRYFQFRYFDPLGLMTLLTGEAQSLLNTDVPFWLMALTCTGLKNGLYIFILRQHFLGLPKALEEAAEVDGAGPFKTFFRIVLPGSINTSITVFMFSFVWQWNDSIYIPVFATEMKVFANQVTTIISRAHIALGISSQDIAASIVGAAALILILLPLILIYAFFQKYFSQSIVTSGLTG